MCIGMVRKEILGTSERKIIEAFLKGERLKGYTAVLFRIRKIGLKAIIEGCEKDLVLLKKLLKSEQQTAKPANPNQYPKP